MMSCDTAGKDSVPARSHKSAVRNSAVEPWTAWTGWRLLSRPEQELLLPLLRFTATLRAVADHPALSIERKEAALAALAAPFADSDATGEVDGRWSETALVFAEVLKSRGLDTRPAWQMLQAAGQDLRKTRYRDWSDLLTWCRFAGAPVAAVACRLLGGGSEAVRKAEALGIALQLVEIVRLAPSHYAWLGRVYLPERWFRDARCEMADFGFARISDPLRLVIGRALDQAATLLDEGAGAASGLSGFRLRMAFHALVIEASREIALLRRQPVWRTIRPAPTPWARRIVTARAALAAFRSR